jgi:hypothetical protein
MTPPAIADRARSAARAALRSATAMSILRDFGLSSASFFLVL